MLLFWELVSRKAINWCNMGYIDLRFLFVCRYEKFLFVSYLYVPISCFKFVFLRKAIMSCELLNISLKLLSMFNMCQCLFIISFMFGSTELYVTKNGIESVRLGLQFCKSNDLFRWSTLSICFLTVYSL